MVDLFELPVDIGPIDQSWIFDPSRAHLLLPDVQRNSWVVDFGDVPVGTRATNSIPFDSIGDVDLWVRSPMPASGFEYPRASVTTPGHSTIYVPVDFAPRAEGLVEVRVPFQTNDPDTPALYVTLRGNGIAGATDAGGITDVVTTDASADAHGNDASDARGEASADGGSDGVMRGSCGCRVPGGSRSHGPAGVFAAIGIAMVIRRRRRG
jgi:MYXO-CTERM domain-containing protein